MTLKKIIGTGAIAGALGFSAIGLAGVASAAAAQQDSPGVVHQAQLTGWGGPGWHGPGWHGRDWRGGGWGRPGWGAGWGGPPLPPPCPFGICI